MALQRNEHPRADKLAALAEWYAIPIRASIDLCESSAEEDLHMHLFYGEDGLDPEPIGRWCAVTSSGEYTYLYPLYDTREDAEDRTVEYPDDDIYSEAPVAVVDLDSDVEMFERRMGRVYPLRKLIAIFATDEESQVSENHD